MITFLLTLLFSLINIFGIIYSDMQIGISIFADLIFNIFVFIITFFIFKAINKKYSEKLKIVMLIYATITLFLIIIILITKKYDLNSSLVCYIGIFLGYILSIQKCFQNKK